MTTRDAVIGLADTYLSLLKHSRRQPSPSYDGALAQLRDALAEATGSDAEHIQVSFELVADCLIGKDAA